MEVKEVILWSLKHSQGYLAPALNGLTQEEAAWSPTPECNNIAFLLWHVTRVEDFFINRAVQRKTEVYEAEGWQERLGTTVKGTGYGYTEQELQSWLAPKLEYIIGYHESVREKTLNFIQSITPQRLVEVPRPDRSPESIGETLARIATHFALHVGQIAYLRGLQRGINK